MEPKPTEKALASGGFLGGSGVFLTGSKKKLEEIAGMCNKVLEARWENAKEAISSFQKSVSQDDVEIAALCNKILENHKILEDRGEKSDKAIKSLFEKLPALKKNLSRSELDIIKEIKKKITANLSKKELKEIARIEFAHFFVCCSQDLIMEDSLHKNWKDLEDFDNVSKFETNMITQELRKKIEEKVDQWLKNTLLKKDLSNLKIGSNPQHFKKAKKFLAECRDNKLYFLIGIEPLSLNSILSGYGQEAVGDLCFIFGSRQEGESQMETAIREAKEEGAINVKYLLNDKTPKEKGLYMIYVDDSVDIKIKDDDGEPLVTLVGRRRIG